jgi:hypothetical protein
MITDEKYQIGNHLTRRLIHADMTQQLFSHCTLLRSSSILWFVGMVMLHSCAPENQKAPDINYLDQSPPGMEAKLFAPGLISTNMNEHSSPAFSPDGSVVLWTVVDKRYRASMMQMTYEQGKWSSPDRASFADSTADDYYPSFSPDGNKLYFGSRRKVPPWYPGTDMRFWEVERIDGAWKAPVPFDTVVSEGREFAHSITKSGTLYFSFWPEDGRPMDIKKAELKNGRYIKPVVLPFNINSVDYEDGPYISPDESFLIIESQRPEGIAGSLDLYISFKVSGDRWTVPMNMGPKINSAHSERFARLSPDSKYLFFGSSRNQSADNFGFDIYWIDAKVIDELRNEASTRQIIDPELGEQILNALSKKDHEESVALLRRWLDKNPNDLNAVILSSSALRKLKRYAEAENLVDSVPPTWIANPDVLMEMALVKIGMNRNADADKLLSTILTEGDKQRGRYIHLSNELLQMGMYPKSDMYFSRAMDIHSNMYDYYRRAQAYAGAGEKDKAIDHLREAIDRGYTRKQDIENDKIFELLRADRRWQILLAKLKQ